MKIFSVEFEGVYPVGSCLIIAAHNKKEAFYIARETIEHEQQEELTLKNVDEIDITKPCVVEYLDGDY